MFSHNNWTGAGRLQDAPKFYPGKDGKKDRTWFRLAVERDMQKEAVLVNGVPTFNDDGTPKLKPVIDWIACVCFGATAVAVANYCTKGKHVMVEGRLQLNSVQVKDTEGNTYLHPVTGKALYDNYSEVLCSRIRFGQDSKKTQDARATAAMQAGTPAYQAPVAAPPAGLPAYTAPPIAAPGTVQPAVTALAEQIMGNPELLQGLIQAQQQGAPVIPAGPPGGWPAQPTQDPFGPPPANAQPVVAE